MKALSLFEGFGIELEYMIVSEDCGRVLPLCDSLLQDITGEQVSEAEFGAIAWSNELVMHVLEMKTNGPAASLEGLSQLFHESIILANQHLRKYQARLLGSSMHPLLIPGDSIKIWPHEQSEIYHSYDRIFGCKGHGWSNLQSMHINLPFANDDDFRRVMAAIRLVLPLIPALTASSPYVENKPLSADSRLEFYMKNQQKVPEIAGSLIPEPVYTRKEYEEKVLQKIFRAIDPFDPDKILQEEWLNSRAAIARFDRMAIEIRICDIQEAPVCDLAIAEIICKLIKRLVERRDTALETFPTEALKELLVATVKTAEKTEINNKDFLSAMGLATETTARDMWMYLCSTLPLSDAAKNFTAMYDKGGTLASRILKASRNGSGITHVYQNLADCLQNNTAFHGS